MRKLCLYYQFSGFQATRKSIFYLPFFLFLILAYTGSLATLKAQDIIRMKDGKEIKANVVEDANNLIKYRDYGVTNGPLYSVRKDQVESVKYKKGHPPSQEVKEATTNSPNAAQADTGRFLSVKKRYVLQNGKTLSPRNVKTLMEDNTEALLMYDKGRRQCNISNLCAGLVVITSFTATMISNGKSDSDEQKRISAIGLGIDGVFLIGGIIFASVGKQNIKKSVNLYNSSLNKPVTMKVDFGIQDNGIGFSVRF